MKLQGFSYVFNQEEKQQGQWTAFKHNNLVEK